MLRHERISIDLMTAKVIVKTYFLVLSGVQKKLRLGRETKFFISGALFVPFLVLIIL